MKITAKVTGDTAVISKIRKMPDGIMNKVETAVQRLVIDLQRRVMQDKLSGQVLKVKTGTLRRSIDQAVVRDNSSVIGVVSTNVRYARIHEYGGAIHRVTKPGVARLRTDTKGNLLRQAGHDHLAVFAKAGHKRVREVAYEGGKSYVINMPERSFLRSALKDVSSNVRKGIADATKEGVK